MNHERATMKEKVPAFLLLVCCLAAYGDVVVKRSIHVSAQSKNIVYGEGLQSCGTWAKTIGSTELQQRTQRAVLTSWVRGFITAAGFYTQNLRATDGPGIDVFVDQYCMGHPISPVSNAAIALALELAKP